jgi:hypothetical protein
MCFASAQNEAIKVSLDDNDEFPRESRKECPFLEVAFCPNSGFSLLLEILLFRKIQKKNTYNFLPKVLN